VREALVPPDEAAAYTYTPAQELRLDSMRSKAFVGTASQVKARLTTLASQLALDELVVVTWTYEPAARHRSYELLAEAFELAERTIHNTSAA
jgi:alkanesulfonate monooxygenase SsuD/methylene tetrahydromethanopterin reductase-like flavin-dependent oxidoreductase (luciferase family)